jgi:phage-related minor tail protein
VANRIKGITVEIGGDTTKLQTALKGVNGQIKSTQSALKDVEKHSCALVYPTLKNH